MITASGTPDECRAKVAEYVAAGCTCPVLYPLGADVERMIDEFEGWSAVNGPVDLVVTGADLVATVDDERREIAGGWVAIDRRAGRPRSAAPARRAARGRARCCGPTAAWSRRA